MMEKKYLIAVQEICKHTHAEVSFVKSLHDFGLIEITKVENSTYIHQDRVKDLESMIRMHYDLQINVEGIEAIGHLLNRVTHLQNEVIMLRNRLTIYEEE